MRRFTIIFILAISLASALLFKKSTNSTNDSIGGCDKVSQYVAPIGTDTLPCGLRESLDFDADWDFDIKDIYGPMELTDSLRNRIRLFVENEPNFIIYQLEKMYCYKNDELIFDLMKALGNEYIFRPEDKEALYEFLCKNTALYNFTGSRYRMIVVRDNIWPF